MGIRKKQVSGQEYYYLEESIRLEKPRVYSVFLGRRIPVKGELDKKRLELLDKIYAELLHGADRMFLTKEQLIEAEKRRRRYAQKLKRLGKAAQEEKDEIDTVNFVYTTLTTEGVPITKADADLAYKFTHKVRPCLRLQPQVKPHSLFHKAGMPRASARGSPHLMTQKNIRSIRDENLKVALDMIKGLRYVKENKKGIDLAFLLKLHGIIMAEYGEKKPGRFRGKQAYIYLKSYEKAEEIGFRPPEPAKIMPKLGELAEWYNSNVGKLNAIELSALLHLRFYMIHPFEDGNKRVSRLLLNKALFDTGYPMLNISKDTEGYFDALIKSVEKKDEKPFAEFVYGRFIQDI